MGPWIVIVLLYGLWILLVGTPSAYSVWQDSRENADLASWARWLYLGAAFLLIPPWGAYPYFWKHDSEPAISERASWSILGGAIGAAILSILIVELILQIDVHPATIGFIGFIVVGLVLNILAHRDGWARDRKDTRI